MKKYQKPTLCFESFVLAEHIAACSYQLNAADATVCKIVEDRYEGDYANAVGGFTSKPPCDFEYEIYCYTNGSLKEMIFQS